MGSDTASRPGCDSEGVTVSSRKMNGRTTAHNPQVVLLLPQPPAEPGATHKVLTRRGAVSSVLRARATC